MNDHIAKPIDPDLLYRTVLAFAGQRVVPRAGGASHVPSDPPAAPMGLTEIAGVDTEDGLRRVGGNLRLYRSMLQQYADSQATSPAELRAALTVGDVKTAERLAHTLKGVSATLGVKAASAAAAVVEDRLRHGRLEGIGPHLATLEQTTEAVITGIRTALVAAATAVAGSSADPRAVIPLLRRLEALLSTSDGGALDYVLQAQEVLAKALSAEEVAGLTEAVQNFDFEAALERLRTITARLGPPDAGDNDEPLEEVLGRLGAMLADGDGQALETTLAAQASLERAFGVQETDALLREVGNFDFDAALIRVRGLSARAGATPSRE
jgi:HPt (histidine-containing phosphotransfer) domain-containing protein